MFNLNFCFFFCNLICYLFENVSWGYLGWLDSFFTFRITVDSSCRSWILVKASCCILDLSYILFYILFVNANRVCLALHSLRGKLIRRYLLAVQYSISVFYDKAYLPFIALTIFCEYIFSTSMNCL